MDIQIHAQSFVADHKLRELIEQKLKKLLTFFDRIINAEVHLKLSSHQQVKDKTLDIKVHVPGATLFASSTTKHFEESLENVLDSMKAQLKKHKEKLVNTH